MGSLLSNFVWNPDPRNLILTDLKSPDSTNSPRHLAGQPASACVIVYSEIVESIRSIFIIVRQYAFGRRSENKCWKPGTFVQVLIVMFSILIDPHLAMEYEHGDDIFFSTSRAVVEAMDRVIEFLLLLLENTGVHSSLLKSTAYSGDDFQLSSSISRAECLYLWQFQTWTLIGRSFARFFNATILPIKDLSTEGLTRSVSDNSIGACVLLMSPKKKKRNKNCTARLRNGVEIVTKRPDHTPSIPAIPSSLSLVQTCHTVWKMNALCTSLST